MKEVDEAAAEILAAFVPSAEERVPLLSALGRFLARDVHAQHDAPPFDNSAMDGYAVRAHETQATPVTLRVEGESRAGGPTPAALEHGVAQRIFTGAAMPEGADAVVIQENTRRDGERVEILEAIRVGGNVRKRGSDLRAGQPMLPAGTRLLAGELGLLASQDLPSATVHRRPRVAIVSTGDELRDIGEPARPGSIVNSNAYMLAAQVLEAGAEPWVLPPVADTLEAATLAIREGLRADALVIVGGVSVGEYDFVRDALQAAGVRLDFWKVRMKPGKPIAFGRAGEVPVLGLPGNPVSAWVTFELFVRPGLRRMIGDPKPMRPRAQVRLAEALERSPGRPEYMRARLAGTHGVQAHVFKRQGSGTLLSITSADALVIVPGDKTSFAAGSELSAILLG